MMTPDEQIAALSKEVDEVTDQNDALTAQVKALTERAEKTDAELINTRAAADELFRDFGDYKAKVEKIRLQLCGQGYGHYFNGL